MQLKFWANWVTAVLKEYDSYISSPIETYGCPYPKHTPFPHRPCWKGYVRVNKTQLKKHSGKLQFHPLVCHTLPASLAILDFSPMGQWHQSLSPVISDMPTTMIMCQYRSNLCFSHVPTLPLVLFNLTQTQSWWTWQSVESNEASHFVVNWWGSCDIHIGQKPNSSKENGTNTRISFSHSLFYSLVFMICHNFRNWRPRELRIANVYHSMQLHKRKDRKTYCVEKKLYFVCNIMKVNKPSKIVTNFEYWERNYKF